MSDINEFRRTFRNVIEGIIEIGKMVGVWCFDNMVDLIDYTIDKIVSKEEKIEETKHFADGFHEGEWERDINHKPIYDGVYDIDKDEK